MPSIEEIESFTDGDYTYSYDKYSCIRTFYFIHIVFAYFVGLTGLGAFVTRLIPRYKWMHKWFGRGYILSMFWATGTSIVINNTGLPEAVLWSFLWVGMGLTVGWFLINLHQIKLLRNATREVEKDLQKGKAIEGSLEEMIATAKGNILERRSFKERFFSLKAAHGIMFVVSYLNIVGRLFASNQSGDFQCHTYPVYKPIESQATFNGANLTAPYTLEDLIVPGKDPNFSRLPWSGGAKQWGALLFFAPTTLAIIGGAIVSYLAASSSKSKQEQLDNSVKHEEM